MNFWLTVSIVLFVVAITALVSAALRHYLGRHGGRVPISGVQMTDQDPLTRRELEDLFRAESDLREGRYVTIPEDMSDEELFRFLEAD